MPLMPDKIHGEFGSCVISVSRDERLLLSVNVKRESQAEAVFIDVKEATPVRLPPWYNMQT